MMRSGRTRGVEGRQPAGTKRLAARHGGCFAAVGVALALAFGTAGCATQAPHGALEHRIVGTGSPLVVFQSGLGDGLSVWSAVQDGLPAGITSFAFSRAGYGRSASRQGDHSPCAAAAELRGALREAGLGPPYLLVGHSLGGLYQFAFARLYPAEVAGIVLVEPTHPRHWPRLQEEAPALAAVVRAARLAVFSSTMRSEFDDQQRCQQTLSALPALKVPAQVLVRATFVPPESGAFERMSRALWRDWSNLLGAARVEAVAGTGHYIQKDRPDAVVAAIRAVASASAPAAH